MANSAVKALAVAILAAGQSSRFGPDDKLSALIGGNPLWVWSARAGLKIAAKQRFFVTSRADDTDVERLGYEVLINPDASEGMGSSLRLAAQAAIDAGAEALLVLLADMPFVKHDHLDRLIAASAEDPDRPVFSQASDGAPQPPALFPTSYLPLLAAMSGDSGARRFARDATVVEAEAELLVDIDTQADLERAQQIHRHRPL